MKKIFKKLVLIIMASTLAVGLTSCGNSHAQDAKKALKEKYGIEFTVTFVMDGMSSDSTMAGKYRVYCHPKDDESVQFEAIMSKSGSLISDKYLCSLFAKEADDIINQYYAEKGIKATAESLITGVPQSAEICGKQLNQVISEYPTISLVFSTVVCEGVDPRFLYDSVVELLNSFYSGNPEMGLGTMIWKYDENSYEECVAEFDKYAFTNSTTLEQHNPISNISIAIRDGELATSYEEFIETYGTD